MKTGFADSWNSIGTHQEMLRSDPSDSGYDSTLQKKTRSSKPELPNLQSVVNTPFSINGENTACCY